MRRIDDPAAEFVPTVERVFGRPVRVLDGARAVLVDDVKLTLEAGERELWVVEVRGGALERWVRGIEVKGDIEAAVLEAREVVAGG